MVTIVDTNLWIDFTRPGSPSSLKKFIAPYVLDASNHLAEPIIFELLRLANPIEYRQLTDQFAIIPRLATPSDLWNKAAELGQACRKKGHNLGALDLLIASVALHHDATIVTFDEDFQRVSTVSKLLVKLLQRPTH